MHTMAKVDSVQSAPATDFSSLIFPRGRRRPFEDFKTSHATLSVGVNGRDVFPLHPLKCPDAKERRTHVLCVA